MRHHWPTKDNACSSIPEGELTTREELMALVDQYDNESSADRLPAPEIASPTQYSSERKLVISNTEQDAHWPPLIYVWPAQGEERKAVETLERTLNELKVDPDEYYRLYRALPAPRVPFLTADTRHKLLNVMGVVERKDEQTMLRYLSIIDDMKTVGIPLTVSEWNIAISFAGRYVARTSEAEVEGALRMWREMEHVADVRANAATFNILFDVATKAGKFRLGEMIYQEMENRGYPFNRFHHVSVIHYYGLRADGEGVRKAYKALVEAGEIVDTVVLNCMMASLIRAYEPQGAIQIYDRMKKLHETKSGSSLPSRDYKERRAVTKSLMKLAVRAKQHPSRLPAFQEQSVIAPDTKTYRILIHYIAVKSGDLHRTAKLLDEMRWFDVPPHGSIFLALFKAFSIHGGVRYSHWTQSRLESVWKAYLQALDSQKSQVYVGKWMIFWALKAFKICAGEERTLKAWEEIKDKWNPPDDEMIFITSLLSEE
jgi:pentatricopeptide repeat protein